MHKISQSIGGEAKIQTKSLLNLKPMESVHSAKPITDQSPAFTEWLGTFIHGVTQKEIEAQ